MDSSNLAIRFSMTTDLAVLECDGRSSRCERWYSASFSQLSAQCQAGAGRTRDKALVFVDDIALNKPNELARANHFRFCAKGRFPYRA
jgi:hypothetical protein